MFLERLTTQGEEGYVPEAEEEEAAEGAEPEAEEDVGGARTVEKTMVARAARFAVVCAI